MGGFDGQREFDGLECGGVPLDSRPGLGVGISLLMEAALRLEGR
jgi:hypothetical protein